MRHKSDQPAPAIDTSLVNLLLMLGSVSKREVARRAGLDPMVVVRTLANRPGVCTRKRALVVRALAAALDIHEQQILLSPAPVNGAPLQGRGGAQEEGLASVGQDSGSTA